MKLDVTALRYLSKDDFRTLAGVEAGMKTHDMVPVEVINNLSNLRHGGSHKFVSNLARHKLVHHESKHYNGYRLTKLGYDYLAINALKNKGHIKGVGRQIGVGKESDIFLVQSADDEEIVMKLSCLGRTSFRNIKNKRDYKPTKGGSNWLYLSKLSSKIEFEFMSILYKNGFPTPIPMAHNRHAILMNRIPSAHPLNQITHIGNVPRAYDEMIDIIVRLGKAGLIHGDYNEFNMMMHSDTQELTMIDFPQMVSMSHPNARMYFERDVTCVKRFFRKRFDFISTRKPPSYDDVYNQRTGDLDVQIKASGFNKLAKAEMFDPVLEEDDKEEGEYEEEEGEKDDEEEEDYEYNDDPLAYLAMDYVHKDDMQRNQDSLSVATRPLPGCREDQREGRLFIHQSTKGNEGATEGP